MGLEGGLTAVAFCSDRDLLPQVAAPGDIILLRNVTVRRRLTGRQRQHRGSCGRQSGTWAAAVTGRAAQGQLWQAAARGQVWQAAAWGQLWHCFSKHGWQGKEGERVGWEGAAAAGGVWGVACVMAHTCLRPHLQQLVVCGGGGVCHGCLRPHLQQGAQHGAQPPYYMGSMQP
jgi:hypothetical protein